MAFDGDIKGTGLDERLVDFLYGEMTKQEEDEFLEQLEARPDLKEELSRLSALKRGLDRLESPEPPAMAIAAIKTAARQELERELAVQPSWTAWLATLILKPQFGLGLAAMMVVAVGVYMLQQATRPTDLKSTEEVKERMRPGVKSAPAVAEERAEKREEKAKEAREEAKKPPGPAMAERMLDDEAKMAKPTEVLARGTPAVTEARNESGLKAGGRTQAEVPVKTVKVRKPADEGPAGEDGRDAGIEDQVNLPAHGKGTATSEAEETLPAEVVRTGMDKKAEPTAAHGEGLLLEATVDGGNAEIEDRDRGGRTKDKAADPDTLLKKKKVSKKDADEKTAKADKKKAKDYKPEEKETASGGAGLQPSLDSTTAPVKETESAKLKTDDSEFDSRERKKSADSKKKRELQGSVTGSVVNGDWPDMQEEKKKAAAGDDHGGFYGTGVDTAKARPEVSNEAVPGTQLVEKSPEVERRLNEEVEAEKVALQAVSEGQAGGEAPPEDDETTGANLDSSPSDQQPKAEKKDKDAAPSGKYMFAADTGADEDLGDLSVMSGEPAPNRTDQPVVVEEPARAEDIGDLSSVETEDGEQPKAGSAPAVAEPVAMTSKVSAKKSQEKDKSVDCSTLWSKLVALQSSGDAGQALKLLKEFEKGDCEGYRGKNTVAMKKAELLIADGKMRKARKILKRLQAAPAMEQKAVEMLDTLK